MLLANALEGTINPQPIRQSSQQVISARYYTELGRYSTEGMRDRLAGAERTRLVPHEL